MKGCWFHLLAGRMILVYRPAIAMDHSYSSPHPISQFGISVSPDLYIYFYKGDKNMNNIYTYACIL